MELEVSVGTGMENADAEHHILKVFEFLLPSSVLGFPGSFPGGKESACNAGDLGSISGSGRSHGEGNGYPLQYSGLENSMDRGTKSRAWLQFTGSQRVEHDCID